MEMPVQTTVEANTNKMAILNQLPFIVQHEGIYQKESITSGYFYDEELSGHSTNIRLNENWLGLEVASFLAQEGVAVLPGETSSSDFYWADELNEGLYDLRQATNEAIEEGFPVPSGTALENADRLLREMYRISPRRFEVYPTPDGEIAIDAPGGHGRSVLLLCDSEGGALCLVNMNGNPRRARYSTTERLPDGFVREALAELEHESYQAQ